MPKRYFNRVEAIDYFIRIKGTGNPKSFAKRIGISESRLYEYLNLMREKGAPIKYDKFKESYYYSAEGKFDFSFRIV